MMPLLETYRYHDYLVSSFASAFGRWSSRQEVATAGSGACWATIACDGFIIVDSHSTGVWADCQVQLPTLGCLGIPGGCQVLGCRNDHACMLSQPSSSCLLPSASLLICMKIAPNIRSASSTGSLFTAGTYHCSMAHTALATHVAVAPWFNSEHYPTEQEQVMQV